MRGARWNCEQLEELARSWTETNGRPPIAGEWASTPGYPTHKVINRRYGTWHDFLVAAGLPPTRKRYTSPTQDQQAGER